MSDLLKTQHDNGVLELSLNRPDKKNALTLAMYGALVDALESAAADEHVRVVLLRGEGDSFSAGNDLADFLVAAQKPEDMKIILKYLHTLVDFPKPLVAAAQGNAVGIGTTMLLHCDRVLVADNLKAQMPFVKLGLVPEGGTSLLLPLTLGHRLAFELVVEGALIDADRACSLGIANEAVPNEKLREQALTVAENVAKLPSEAVRQSKAMLKKVQRAQLHEVIDEEGLLFSQRLSSDEARTALMSFLQKRT